MFSTFFRFELRYWLRGMMLYVFIIIMSLMMFGAASVDEIQVGFNLKNINRNAPFAIQMFYVATSTLSCLMVTAFVNAAACRDFSHNTHQLIFTKPMSKFGYLMGRFWGSVAISVLPMLGASIGVLAAQYMPWADPKKWGPIHWEAHFLGIVCFAIPNAIFIGCIVFAIASWTRSALASFVGIMGLIVGLSIAALLAGDLENETLLMFIDPFGESSFLQATKYWTVAQRNTQALGLTGPLLRNRLLWLSVGGVILAITCWRFSFSGEPGELRQWTHSIFFVLFLMDPEIPVVGWLARTGICLLTLPLALLSGYRHGPTDDSSSRSVRALPAVKPRSGFGASLTQLRSQIRVDAVS
ncbi:MAG: ABC transporter permease, partial [Planctomycetaceae bacterium]